jgi:hypothetical protein
MTLPLPDFRISWKINDMEQANLSIRLLFSF